MLIIIIDEIVIVLKILHKLFFRIVFVNDVSSCFRSIKRFFDVFFFICLISRIWRVFLYNSQKLFKNRQNKWDKYCSWINEKLILIFLILINKIFKLIRNIILWRSKLLKKNWKLKIVDVKLLKIVLSFTILLIYLSIFVDIIDIIKIVKNNVFTTICNDISSYSRFFV